MKKLSFFSLIGLLIALVCALAIAANFWAPKLFAYVLLSRVHIATFIANNYALSIMLFFLIYIADNIFMLPIASLLTLLAGMFFSPLVATIITLCAATLGAMVSFFLARYLVGKRLQETYAKELKRFNELFSIYGTYYLLIVRLMPIIPFVMVNILAGLTLVRTKTFVITTFLGLIPLTLLLVFSGQELQHAVTLREILSGKMIFMGIMLALLTILPLLVKKSRVML